MSNKIKRPGNVKPEYNDKSSVLEDAAAHRSWRVAKRSSANQKAHTPFFRMLKAFNKF